MKSQISQVLSRRDWVEYLPLVLFGVAIVGYGLLIPWMGFFWDDFPVAWIADRLGSPGLTRYFSDNRPLLSWLYRVSVTLFGTQTPWHWHVFALLTRFTASLSFYQLVRTIWPKFTHLAVWAGLFFLVYPGFKQQWVSIIYGHFFLILTGLLISFFLNIRVARRKLLDHAPVQGNGGSTSWSAWLLTAVAWLLALQNLILLDYFFFLEIIRPVFIWEALREQVADKRKRIFHVFNAWLPYLILWVGAVAWRLISLQSQPHRYQITFFDGLREAPLDAVLKLASNILHSLWISTPVAWGMVFRPPESSLGMRTILTAILLTGSILVALATYLILLRHKYTVEEGARHTAITLVLTGLLTCLAAGWSIWLPGLEIGTEFAADRFSLVFLPGSALILAGLIGLLPLRNLLPWFTATLVSSLAIGQQFIAANTFRLEWEIQQRFFWQLTWRIPAIEPGTLLLADELPFTYYTDNSLTAPINWFFAGDNRSQKMSYLLFYPARRLGTSLPGLEPGLRVHLNYLAATFDGNTSQAVGLVFIPPACLRVLEPDLDVENKMLPEVMQQAAILSSTSHIKSSTTDQSVSLPVQLYGQEPAHNWCYYFEKADLARQQGNWEQVANLGDQAFATGDYPNDPMERLPFIEGYVHVANWSRALELSRESQQITPKMEPILCRLWNRISETIPASVEKDTTLQVVLNELNCAPK